MSFKKYKHIRSLRSAFGFTLLELILTIGIFSTLIASLYGLFTFSNKIYSTHNRDLWLLNDVSAAAELISYDIKMAGLDPLASSGAGFEEAMDSKIRITSDRNINGAIDNDHFERITYEFDSKKKILKRILYETTESETSQTLLTDISNISFQFYCEKNKIVNAPQDIKSVIISFDIEKEKESGDNPIKTLIVRTSSRNF